MKFPNPQYQGLESGPIVEVDQSDLEIDAKAHQLIESVELQLRDLIDERLSAVGGSRYWDQTVPSGIQSKVFNKIGQHVMAHPYINPAVYVEGRKRLDFCDIGDYLGIIKANWPQFSELLLARISPGSMEWADCHRRGTRGDGA